MARAFAECRPRVHSGLVDRCYCRLAIGFFSTVRVVTAGWLYATLVSSVPLEAHRSGKPDGIVDRMTRLLGWRVYHCRQCDCRFYDRRRGH